MCFCFLATVDVKRNIFDLCTDTKDCYLAVIEVLQHLCYQRVYCCFHYSPCNPVRPQTC